MLKLYEHQNKAVNELRNGSILVGDVGSGKSRTALAYYIYKVCRLNEKLNTFEEPRDLYIITTAKKRDSMEWWKECCSCFLYENYKNNPSCIRIYIDSWNNIKKYKDVYGAFFIFDEQRVVGSGAWVKAFLKIARKNKWILLSATPGDQWTDYIPVFIANGFYRNKSDFRDQHIVYNPYCTKYPQIDKYINTGILNKHRQQILVRMEDKRQTKKFHIKCSVDYDKHLYLRVWRDRWNPFENEPIKETGKLFYLLRRVVNSDESRIKKLGEILEYHSKAIIFYNFVYEIEEIKKALERWEIPYSEWNGQKHEEILDGNYWVYLVQYTAGAEGWNCITTDTIIFYSLTYSYRARKQAEGRIDRLNTPFENLFYYHIMSFAPIDLAIQKALKSKKNFNERNFMSANPV